MRQTDFSGDVAVLSETGHPGFLHYTLVGSAQSLARFVGELQVALSTERSSPGVGMPLVSLEVMDATGARDWASVRLMLEPDLSNYRANRRRRRMWRDWPLLLLLVLVGALSIIGLHTAFTRPSRGCAGWCSNASHDERADSMGCHGPASRRRIDLRRSWRDAG